MPVEALRTKPCDLISSMFTEGPTKYRKKTLPPYHKTEKKPSQTIDPMFLFFFSTFFSVNVCRVCCASLDVSVVALTCVLMWPLRAHKISTFLWWFLGFLTHSHTQQLPTFTPLLPLYFPLLFFFCCCFSVSFDWFWYGKWQTALRGRWMGG